MRLVPFIKMVGLNGSVACGDATEKSDIDFLIIARAGRLYTARAFATFLIQLTGYRRHGDKIAGRICLNCYLSDEYLSIELEKESQNQKVARANKYLVALVDSDNVAARFFEENKWFDEYTGASIQYTDKIRKKLIPNGPRKPIKIFEIFLYGGLGDLVERYLMNYQIKRILSGKKPGDEIYVTENFIKLHPKKY